MTRHGRPARTPTSAGDPALLGDRRPRRRRSLPGSGVPPRHRGRRPRAELLGLAGAAGRRPPPRSATGNRPRPGCLDWLESFPGDNWQDRWSCRAPTRRARVGAAERSPGAAAGSPRARRAARVRAVRPSYRGCSAAVPGAYDPYRRHNQPATFAGSNAATEHGGCDEYTGDALNPDPAGHRHRQGRADLDLADLTAYARPPAVGDRWPRCRSPTTCCAASAVCRRTADVGAAPPRAS